MKHTKININNKKILIKLAFKNFQIFPVVLNLRIQHIKLSKFFRKGCNLNLIAIGRLIPQ